MIDQPGAAPISVIDQPESGSVSSITNCPCWDCRNAAAVVPQMMAVTVRAAKTNVVIVALLRQRLLRRACHTMNLARERGVPLNSGLIALMNAVTTPSWRKAWRSTKYSLHWQNPGAVAVRRDG